MKKKLLLSIVLIGWLIGNAQAQKDLGVWAKQIEGHESSYFNNVLYDGKDIIVNGTWLLDAEFEQLALPYHVGTNALIAKLDTAGNIKWSATLTGDSYDSVFDMVLDSDKNIGVIGWTSSDIYVNVNDVTVYTPELIYTTRGFIAKFSGETGKLIWYKTFLPYEQYMGVYGSRLAVDSNNNIYAAGYYNASFMYEELSFHYGQEGWGSLPFVLKLDTHGKAIWGQTFNFVKGEYGGYFIPRSLAVNNNKLYMGFEYSMPLIVNTDTMPHTGMMDWVGIVSLSVSNGAPVDKIALGTEAEQGIAQIKFDKNNDLIAGGYFTCGTDFKIGNTTLTGTETGTYNAYLAKFNSKLEPIWAKPLESRTAAYIFNINIGNNNNLYLGGGYYSATPVVFDKQPIVPVSAIPSAAMFQAVFDNDGKFVTSLSLNGINENSIINYRNSTLISDNKLIVVGNTLDSVQLSKNVKVYSDHNKAFIMKWEMPQIQTTGNFVIKTQPLGIYPNPSSGTIHISNIENISRIEIYSMQGVLVKSFNRLSLHEQLSIADLNDNMYIVRTMANGEIFTDKILLKR